VVGSRITQLALNPTKAANPEGPVERGDNSTRD
jgi:hypothetical protein